MSAIWLLAILLVAASGNFPLNDDFSYGRSVLNLLEQGRLLYDSWLSMTLLTQVLWGAAFCKVFGFSFTVLRCSTLVLAWIGLLACYFLCRELGHGKKISTLAALTIAFNPFFFSLSFTFMTDVPFFTFCVLATLFYGKSFRSGKTGWIIAGTFFALAATFVRQLGLMLPLSFALAWLCREGFRPKSILTALIPAGLTLALFLWYSNWLASVQDLPGGYGNFQKLFKRIGEEGFWNAAFYRTGILAAYLGAFLLPVSLLLLPVLQRRLFHRKKWLTGIGLALLLATFTAAWDKLPWGNILYNAGIGPKLLKDGYINLNLYPLLPMWALNVLKIIGLIGALLLFFLQSANLSIPFFQQHSLRPIQIFALTNLTLYFGFLVLDMHFFDRYFFQILPFLLVIILPTENVFIKKSLLRAAIAVIVLQASFSISATHDYLAWNRARWVALDYLTKEKNIAPNQIDGGFEFNGWHKPGPRDNGPWKSWWWVDRDDYVIAFGDLHRFSKEKGFPFVRWLPPGVDSVYVLKHD